ncbi:MAG: DNA internalization-related competence protein ComEC/Rec2 [Desulfobulbus sp.]|jgi:competence protein ComEC
MGLVAELPHRLLRACLDNLLVAVTLCFIAGATLALYIIPGPTSFPLVPWGFAVLTLGLVVTVCVHQTRFFILPLFVLLGLVHTHLALQPPQDPHHLFNRIQGETECTLVGRVLAMPEQSGDISRLVLDTRAILAREPGAGGAFQPARGKVLLIVRGTADFVHPGETLMAMATLSPIHGYQTPGAFDFRLHMATQKIFCSGRVASPGALAVVHEPQPSFGHQMAHMAAGPERHRQRSAAFLERHFSPEIAGLYQALLIGRIALLPQELLDAFKAVGCFHILSISGLHFSLLGIFVAALWKLLLKRSQWLLLHTHVPALALLLTAPVLIVYTAIAGMNLPALRSLCTALLVLFAVYTRRRRSMLHLIAAAALILLLINPLSLFTPSFQLSFASVLAINLIVPRLPLLRMVHEEAPRPSRLHKAGATILSLFYVSLAATAGTLPIQLFHFNQFSLVGPVMNLLIEPLLCLWALPCGLLAIPCIDWAPDLARLFLHMGAPGIELAVWLTLLVGGIPGVMLWTITPNILETTLYFLALILLLAPHRNRLRLALAACCLAALLCSFSPLFPQQEGDGAMRVHFLDVGQGNASLIQFPDRTTMLIDGGGGSERFDPGQRLIAPFLWQLRIWQLDCVVISHPHSDHYRGLPFILERFRPRQLLVNGVSGTEPAYARLLADAGQGGISAQAVGAGDQLWSGPGVRLHCLGMPGLETGGPVSINNTSLVLHLRYKNRAFLFPGDIEVEAEQRLLRASQNLRADVLLAPHHGSRTSSSAPFIAAVDPAVIVVSSGRQSRTPLPWPGHLAAWRQQQRSVLITGTDGTVTCWTDGEQLRIHKAGDRRGPFRSTNEDAQTRR